MNAYEKDYRIGELEEEVRNLNRICDYQKTQIKTMTKTLNIIRQTLRNHGIYEISDMIRDGLINLKLEVKDNP